MDKTTKVHNFGHLDSNDVEILTALRQPPLTEADIIVRQLDN